LFAPVSEKSPGVVSQSPAAVLKLATILQYLANVVGERVNTVRFGNLMASDHLSNT
jgi:hypothetical protein